MEGKRVSQPSGVETATKKKGGKALWIALGLAAALVVGGTAGFAAYANGYEGVFPGVTMAGEDLSGLTREELGENLPVQELLQGEISLTANGEDLGSYTQEQLGAYIDREELTDEIWSVGREEGGLGWLKNGLTMLKGRLGTGTDLEPRISGYDESALRRVSAEAASAFDREPVDGSYNLSRDGLFATKPADGQRIIQEELVEVLSELEGASGQVEAPWETVPGQSLDLNAVAQELNAEPRPARYDVAQGKVVDGEVGVRLDPEAASFVLDAALPGETVELPAEVIYPAMTAQELEAVLFRDVLSTATTNVSGSSARKGNVKLAGESVNGTILNDGDIFDYNQVVGKRTKERGFGEAATYVNGETVNTVGGGICQVSSTIYLATLLANLEIVERYNHRFYPGYITMGMDATVSWGGPEFRFKNNTGYPIRIDVSYANSKLTVTVVGTKVDDTYVKMTYDLLSTTAYETEYVNDPTLPYGTQKQKQNGYTGREVVSYRNVYKGDGTLISSNVEAKSSYKSRNQIILVGTGGAPTIAAAPPAGTETPVLPPDTGGATVQPETPAAQPSVDDEPAPPPSDSGIPGWLTPME